MNPKGDFIGEDFMKFMNDRGEMRRLPYRIVATKTVRNPRMERRIVEMNRERNLFYVMLAGSILMLAGLMF
jgi:hypothetical protein